MHSILHDIGIGLEIWAGSATGLVILSFLVAQLRHLLNLNAVAFKYPQDVPRAEAQAASEPYWHRGLVALDIFMNVVFLRGQQDETMSTHAWRAALLGHTWGRLMNLWLNGFQAQHGPQAASGDLERSAARVAVLTRLLGLN